MADIVQPMRFEIDVKSGLVTKPQRTILMKGDKNANRIIAVLTEDGEPLNLIGVTVTGRFIRPPDGAEVPLTGEAVGNEARVTLIDQCYASDGYYEASIILTMGDVRRTVLSISGTVHSAGSGAYVDVSGVIPSVDDIIAQYAEMQRVTTVAQTATNRATEAAQRAENLQMDASGMAGDANRLGGKAPEYYIQPRNLLDNSDFTNPVNLRGQMSYSGHVRTIDRWVLWSASGAATLAVETDYIALDPGTDTAVSLAQRFPKGYLDPNKTYTMAWGNIFGGIGINHNVTYFEEYDYAEITSSTWQGVVWAVLYEGEYTADNLPPHVPKGYAAELMECMRYYQYISRALVSQKDSGIGASARQYIHLPIAMRVIPTVTVTVISGVAPTSVYAINTETIDIQGSAEDYSDFAIALSAEL